MAILVVEDESDLSDVLCYILRRAGHDVIVAFDGDTALRLWRERDPELVLLDIGLPRTNGWDVCRTIRAESTTPIMILSGADAEDDMLHGFDLGAEDYMAKPFSPKILQARIATLLRRNRVSQRETSPSVSICDLRLNANWRTVSRGDRQIQLTRLEFRVLRALALRFGQVVEHPELIQAVWGYRGEASSNIVKGHIRNIRMKLDEIGSKAEIRIIQGVGYILSGRSGD